VRKINEMRGNYFTGVEQANRMALRILELQGSADFGDTTHRIIASSPAPPSPPSAASKTSVRS
jgi:hypothetical protein